MNNGSQKLFRQNLNYAKCLENKNNFINLQNRNNKPIETKRREILDKWFSAFQLSIGLPNEPLTDHAAEYLEAAMQEYANLNSK